MKKLLLFTMLLATIAISSCSKDSAKPTLVGKWKVASSISKLGTSSDTYIGLPADYFDFKSNGILEYFVDGIEDTLEYTISGNTVTIEFTTISPINGNIVNSQQTYTLTLTATTATLYFTELSNGVRYESTINLKK